MMRGCGDDDESLRRGWGFVCCHCNGNSIRLQLGTLTNFAIVSAALALNGDRQLGRGANNLAHACLQANGMLPKKVPMALVGSDKNDAHNCLILACVSAADRASKKRTPMATSYRQQPNDHLSAAGFNKAGI